MAKTKETDNSTLIEQIKKRYSACTDAWSDQHETMREDLEFVNDGKQWDDGEVMSRVGRPSLVINKVAGLCKTIIGDARQNKPGVKVRPVDDQSDVQTAEILNGLIRNIENISDAETCYDTAFESSVRAGLGFWRVLTDYSRSDTFDQDILLKRVTNAFSILFDPAAIEITFEDARFCFVTSDMPKKDFEDKYPDQASDFFDTVNYTRDGSLAGWLTENTVKVSEYWYKVPKMKTLIMLIDGRTVIKEDFGKEDWQMLEPLVKMERRVEIDEVMWCLTNGVDILEGPRVWPGQYIPIVPCCGEELFVGDNRSLASVIKWAKDPQRLYNWARSNAAETLALAPKQPFIATPEAIEGYEQQWNQHHVKPMPYLLVNKGETIPQRQPASIPDTGNIQESMQASEDIKSVTGIYDASLGNKSNETSGVAIVARQREGDNATFQWTDNLNKAIAFTGRILVDLIPKIYDTERVVRLLNQDGSEGWATINQEMPGGGRTNDISLGKYDVVLESGPGYLTKRIEAANAMVSLLQAVPQAAPVIVPRLAKNLDWPEAQEIAEELTQLFQPPPPPQGPPPPTPEELMTLEKKQLDIAGKKLTNEGTTLLNHQREIDLGQELGSMMHTVRNQPTGEY